jgi:hypothetical protein
MPDAPNPMNDTPTTRTTQQARQGETTGRMRTVLGISLFVAVLAVVGLAVDWHEARTTAPPVTPPASNAQPTSTPNAPAPNGQVPNNTNPTPPNNQGNN